MFGSGSTGRRLVEEEQQRGSDRMLFQSTDLATPMPGSTMDRSSGKLFTEFVSIILYNRPTWKRYSEIAIAIIGIVSLILTIVFIMLFKWTYYIVSLCNFDFRFQQNVHYLNVGIQVNIHLFQKWTYQGTMWLFFFVAFWQQTRWYCCHVVRVMDKMKNTIQTCL